MSADKSFRGTLLALQNKTRRDPESYIDEFRTQLKHFDAVAKSLLGAGANFEQASNPQFLAVMQFVCNVGYCYPDESGFLPQLLVDLLEAGKGSIRPDGRLALVNCLILLRNKNLASTDLTMPVFFGLLQSRDKTLRKVILSHIVNDIRRINLPGAKDGSAKVNRQIQSFLFKVMQDDDAVQARCALTIMIDLYRRQLWCNDRTVQVIATACFSRHTLILRMALHFFMMQMPKFSSVGSDSDSDEQDPGRIISRLKHKLKHTAKTGKRERVLKNKVDGLKKRFDENWRADRDKERQLVDPVRLMQDPQGFAERLLSKLHKTAERFEVRLLMMSVLARVISEHELLVLGVFPLLERYLEPSQLHSTTVLSLASTCVHRMVPPDALESFVRTIADRFVNDRSDQDSITIGINTIREICKRQPLAMNADLLNDLVGYKQRRGERGIIMAARSLLQLYREVNPELLAPKLRGSKAGASDAVEPPKFGAAAPLRDIPGLEALFASNEPDVANSDDLGSDTSSDDIELSISGDADEWEMVSHDSDDDDLSEGDVNDDDDNDAGVPQLVPVRGAKRRAASHRDSSAASTDVVDEMPANLRGLVSPAANGFVAADDIWVDSDDDDTDGAEGVPAPPRTKHRAENPQVDAIEEESDDDAQEDSSSGEWVNVDGSDEELALDSDSGADGSEDDSMDDEEDDGSDDESANSDDDVNWTEDTATPAARSSTVGVSSVGKQSAASMRTLTDAEFETLRRIQSGGQLHQGKVSSKALEKQSRMSRKDALVRDIGERGQLLDPSSIETFTGRKRERDRDKKIEEAQKKRHDNNPFNARKKKKTKLNTTHREKQKIGKLFQMTKRSGRVAEKLKRSVEERRDHAKDMKKKNIKFRIARGWKA